MSSCAPTKASGGCGPSDFGACLTLEQMVSLFLKARATAEVRAKAWWGDPQLSMKEACRRAMFALGNEQARDGHQWIFSKADLAAMGNRLGGEAVALQTAENFQDLYRRIERALGLVRNQKPLLVYDIARRLGFRLALDPEEVYLHAGPQIGANALKRGFGRPRSRPLADFPTSIRTRLTPAQAEDFLCLAAKQLRPDLWD